MKNLKSIVNHGLFKSSFENGVYLTDSQQSAVAWKLIGAKIQKEDILVLKVKVPASKIRPGVDHSPLMQELFCCGESYLYMDAIPPKQILEYVQFKL